MTKLQQVNKIVIKMLNKHENQRKESRNIKISENITENPTWTSQNTWSTNYSLIIRFVFVCAVISVIFSRFIHARTRKLGSRPFSRTFSKQFLFFFIIFFFVFFIYFFQNTYLTSNKASFSSPFTGYLPIIFMESAFNNYISYKSFVVFGYVVQYFKYSMTSMLDFLLYFQRS